MDTKNKYLQKKCKKEQSSKPGDGIKKTYPNAIPGDANKNGIETISEFFSSSLAKTIKDKYGNPIIEELDTDDKGIAYNIKGP